MRDDTLDLPTTTSSRPAIKGPEVRDYASISVDAGPVATKLLVAMRKVDPNNASVALRRLARRFNVSPWTVYRWVRGKSQPTRASMTRIDRMAGPDSP